MRIAMIGAGGVGAYYGALLAQGGHDVSLYARGDHLAAIRRNGLLVHDHGASASVQVYATDCVEDLTGIELAILAVKSYALPSVSPVVARLAKAGSLVVPLLNGVDMADRLAANGVPAAQILGGSTFVSASRTAPGEVTRHSTHERVVVGELGGGRSTRVERVAEALRSMRVEVVATEAVTVELWQKYNFICAISAACGMARAPLGMVRETELGRVLLERAVGEIAAVARAMDISIPADQEARTLAFIENLSGTLTPSFLLDVQRGGPTELDILSAAVAAFGRKVGVPTPVHDTAAAVLPM